MASIPFDEEALETLVYERSKTWSNFLKYVEGTDEGVEVELNQLDELFKNDVEESIVATDEAEEDKVEDEANKSELAVMLCSEDNKEILNQTMPIVEEHVRKWKAAGLDRILNTFDAQKIEQHVGDWLRRHNSAYGDKTLLQTTPPKTCQKRHKMPDHRNSGDVSHDSETESMHSMETARYIRASRKRTESAGSKCSNNSPMTTIKMYRTLPRKRDELRAKYGYNEYNDDQEHRRHMQALLNRRVQLHRRKRERELIFHTSPRHYPYSVATSFTGQHRRKQLRKRRDSSPHFSSPSSSEDERGHGQGHGHCDCSACIRRAFSKTTYPYCAYRNYHSHSRHDYHHQRLELDSRSMHSQIHFKRSVCQLRRQHAFEEDMRPRLMEDECSCCTTDRLCTNVVHIANSSTEEWLVENRSSPDPVQCLETPKRCTQSATKCAKTPQKLVSMQLEKQKVPTTRNTPFKNSLPKKAEKELEEHLEMRRLKSILNVKQLCKSETKKTKALVTFSSSESNSLKALSPSPSQSPSPSPTKPKSTPAPKASLSKSAAVSKAKIDKQNKTLANASSLPEMSKETKSKDVVRPKKAQKEPVAKTTKQKKSSTKSAKKVTVTEKISKRKQAQSKNSMKNTESSTTKAKLSKNSIISDSDEPDESDDFEDNALKLALKISKKTFMEEQKKALSSLSPQLPEQLIFNNQSVACNSTALTNDMTACGRALKPTMNKNEKLVNVASTSSSNPCSSSALEASNNCDNHSDGDADCTVVTSTTSCEAAVSPVAEVTVVTQHPRVKLTKKGILLHAPPQLAAADQTNNLSSNSSASNGNFTLTEDILGPIIGQRTAQKFLKYHCGSRSFDSRYSVYYRPTAKLAAKLSADIVCMDSNSSSSNDSDVDIFERVRRYGEIYTVLEK